jgi:transcriptional regulator with XRE-family HTH domain
MKTEHSLPNKDLAFPFSLEETTGPQVSGPSRFARALKQARFAKGWTQAELAKQLSMPKRSIVSWETAERLPSIGIVVILLDALRSTEELSLHHELLCAYIVDDLERQENRKDRKSYQDNPLLQRIQSMIGRVLELSTRATMGSSSKEQECVKEQPSSQVYGPLQSHIMSEQQTMEPLFALMNQLHQHPELISVARDFIRELAPGE